MSYCLNCGAGVTGSYCHECGQKVNIKRLNAKVLLEEFGHFITHAEHYFLKTTKEFILRPGKNSLDYLKGKRKHYQKPVSFFLIWAGLYILLHNFILKLFHFQITAATLLPQTQLEKANEFFRSHFTLFFLPVLVVSSVIIYFILAKPRFYYIEILTLCLYGAGCFNAMLIISDLIIGVLFRININSNPMWIYQTVISGMYNFWFCYEVFSRVHTRFLWIRLFVTAIIISISGWFLFMYLPALWV